jgi:hypothetical protein
MDQPTAIEGVNMLSREEAASLINEAAQHYLQMSGMEFFEAWHLGKFDDDPERPEVMRVAMLLPFAQYAELGR